MSNTKSNTNTKIIVVVHGVGDQIGYASAQSVAYQFCRYCAQPAAIPLGRFHTELAAGGARSVPKPIHIEPPTSGPHLADLGFVEVYWADIPRTVVKEGYVLEEAKRWARTIVGRYYHRWETKAETKVPPKEVTRLETVLEDMFETIFLLERVTWFADRAGIFNFKLRKLLEDYLGDVQLVADFETYRGKILRQFDEVMRKALEVSPWDTELYLVAHSEGSVIAFLALLTAWSQPVEYKWVRSIRGLMTIGSPIETHHQLWPDLWWSLRPSASVGPPAQDKRIRWWNYLDRGDPIAYRLEETREWLNDPREKEGLQGLHPWSDYFEFEKVKGPDEKEVYEKEFSRYYFPGKAHIDYWDDADLFGHFIENVVDVPQPPALRLMSVAAADGLMNEGRNLVIVALVGTDLHIRIFDGSGKKVVDKAENELVRPSFRSTPEEARVRWETLTALKKQLSPVPDEFGLSKEHKQKIIGDATLIAGHTQSGPRDFSHPPEDKRLAKVASATVPYLLVAGLLFAAVSALYTTVITALEIEPAARDVLRDVGGLALLLFGMTAAVRIPRLTGDCWRRKPKLDSENSGSNFDTSQATIFGLAKDCWWRVGSWLILGAAMMAYPFVVREVTRHGLGAIFGEYSHTWGLLGTVFVIAVVCSWFARRHPKWGVRILPLASVSLAAVLVGWLLFRVVLPGDKLNLWPVLLGGAVFFYLWWLAALLFDLTFAWHHYVRFAAIAHHLRNDMKKAHDRAAPANGWRVAASAVHQWWTRLVRQVIAIAKPH